MVNYTFNLKAKKNYKNYKNVINENPLLYNKQVYNSMNASNTCTNGCPTDIYAGYGINASDVLYSIFMRYQNSYTPKWIFNKYTNIPLVQDITFPPPNGPTNIFIIRHAEKNESVNTYKINCNGVYRASKMADFINYLGISGYPISYIVTCNPCPLSCGYSSMRPSQTIQLASSLLSIPLYIYSGNNTTNSNNNPNSPALCGSGYIETANQLFTSNQYNSTNTFLSWEHVDIQGLCNALITAAIQNGRAVGYTDYTDYWQKQSVCSNGSPIYWNSSNYDNVYWFDGSTTDFNFKLFQQPIQTCFVNNNTIECSAQTGAPCWSCS